MVERTITLPIEEQVNGTEGMLYMSSTSANDGQMSMTVTFELGRDPDIAAVNVNNRVAVAEPRLPEEVRRFGVTVRKQSPELTMVVNLLSPDGSRDALFLSNYALINVLDALKRVPGRRRDRASSASGATRCASGSIRSGSRSSALTAADVIDGGARAERADRGRATPGSPPAPTGQQLELPLRTQGPPLHRRGVRADIVIRAEPDGSLLRLGDVARVELGAQSYAGFTRLTGQPAITLGVFQLPEANALDVSRGGARRARRASPRRFPSGVDWHGPLRPDAVRGRVDRRGARDAVRWRCCSSSSSSTSSSRTGARR